MALALCALLPAAAPAAGHAADGDTLTVVTLNLWHDQRDWPRRLAVMLAGLRAVRPDVVCLQEVLQHERLPNQARTLADSLGMRAHFTSVDAEGAPKRYGNAILTRLPMDVTGARALEPRDDYRTVAHARVTWRGRTLDVFDTHLHHTAEGGAIRATQIADLLDFIAGSRGAGALVLAGDFNAGPEAAEMRPLQERFTDAWAALHPGAAGDSTTTLNPAYGHRPARIDRVFVEPAGAARLVPVGAEVLFRVPAADSVWASDHFGVSARFVLVETPRGATGRRRPGIRR